MKTLLLGVALLALILGGPVTASAAVDIHISIPLPPAIVFSAPPEVVVIPDTYVYAIPDIEAELFFWEGWWWRLWEGRWYRSRYYDRDWVYYQYIPYFYYDIDFGWRGYYRDHNWHGHRWDYQRIPYHQLQKNWRSWYRNRYWEREKRWDLDKYQPPAPQQKQELRRQRQVEYGRRPDVRKHEQWRKEQQGPQVRKFQGEPKGHPQVQQPKQQPQGKVHQPQRQEQRPQVQKSQPLQSQGKPRGEDAGPKK